MKAYRVLFVCMGNICRSPAAEGVFQSIVDREALKDKIECDSAGTIGYHSGSPADARMRKFASKRGFDLTSTSRQIVPSDLDDFDLIITMDEDNYHNVRAMDRTGDYSSKISRMTSYCKEFSDTEVPDPYYGGDRGFEHVMDLLEDACAGLMETIKQKLDG